MLDRHMIRKAIGQASLLWWSLAVTLFAFGWVRVWVVKLLDMQQFETILDQFRDFEKFAPVPFDSLFTYTGRVGMTFDEPIVILCTVVWCIARGSDAVSGELGRGTLEMLLAQPISRVQFLMSHVLVTVLGLAALAAVLWGGVTVGIYATTLNETIQPPSVRVPFVGWTVPLTTDPPVEVEVPMRDRVDPRTFGAAIFSLFAFGYFLIGLSTAFSSGDRYRWRTIGCVMAFYVLQLVMYGLGKAAGSLAWLQQLAFFNLYKPQKMTGLVTGGDLASPWSVTVPIEQGGYPPLFYPGLLIAMGTALIAVGLWVFRWRDLPAPL